VRSAAWSGAALELDAPRPLSVAWKGCALLDGREWNAQDGTRVIVPADRHRLAPCAELPARRLEDFNGVLLDARTVHGRLRVRYESRARAIALVRGADGVLHMRMLPAGRQELDLPD
jgi:hypothetical protein